VVAAYLTMGKNDAKEEEIQLSTSFIGGRREVSAQRSHTSAMTHR
jgi:hypothetical protein